MTEQYVFSTKYIYDRENFEAFREEYEQMPFYEKAMENPPLIAGALLIAITVVVGVLTLVL